MQARSPVPLPDRPSPRLASRQWASTASRRRVVGVGAALAVLLAACSGGQAAETGVPSSAARPSGTVTAPVSASPSVAAPSGRAEPTPTTSGGGRSFTLAAAGDVLIHDGVRIQAEKDAGKGERFDFVPTLAGVASAIRGADLAVCHLETPLAGPKGPFRGYPLFYGPPQVARALREIGFDTCSTASNHALDQREQGVRTTLAALDAAGIAHTGMARNAAEDRPAMLDVKGVTVAQLSYTFGFNGFTRPAGKSWLSNAIDDGDILDAAKAARRAGADVVVLSVHWGSEYQATPNAQQRRLAPELLASPDIDLIIGHHAHVVQPLEKIGEEWVAYGVGNMIASKSHNFAGGATREGVIPRFTFTEQGDGRFLVTTVEATPTYIDATAGVLRLVPATAAAVKDPQTKDRPRVRKARARTVEVLTSRGAAEDGLVVH